MYVVDFFTILQEHSLLVPQNGEGLYGRRHDGNMVRKLSTPSLYMYSVGLQLTLFLGNSYPSFNGLKFREPGISNHMRPYHLLNGFPFLWLCGKNFEVLQSAVTMRRRHA